MGMYTGLRCKVIIKPKYRDELHLLHNEFEYEWDKSNFEFLKDFHKFDRSHMIPYGALSYMPDDWEDAPLKEDGSNDWFNATATDGFERNFNSETGLWTFQCSLKNGSTIRFFIENVLSELSEEVIHIEYYYEEWARSVFYDMIDGKIVQSNRAGILYGYEDKW